MPSSSRAYAERDHRDQDPGRTPRHVALDRALREERDHAVTDREEDGQQAAPQRSPHREVQREVVLPADAVGEAGERHELHAERRQHDDGMRHDLRRGEQHAKQATMPISRPRPSRRNPRAASVGPANVPASQSSVPAANSAAVVTYSVRVIERAVHPARKHGEQEAEEHRRKHREQHQPRMGPDRRGLQHQREERRAGVTRDEVQAPTRRLRAAGSSSPAKNSVRCGAASSAAPAGAGAFGSVIVAWGSGAQLRFRKKRRAPWWTPAAPWDEELNPPGRPTVRP